MTYLIKELPVSLRPRERFKNFGPESLSNEELLAIILRTGSKNKSVKDLSTEILKQININDFANLNYLSLKKIKGIGEVKAITILASIEFSKRVLNKNKLNVQIRTSKDVYDIVHSELERELQEKLLVLFLDTRKQVILKKVIFIGTVNSSTIHPRDVFREAVKSNAVSIILVHNHPAGSIEPSYQDIYMTTNFIKIGKIVDIDVIDHLIIGHNNYYSFRENKGDLFNEQ